MPRPSSSAGYGEGLLESKKEEEEGGKKKVEGGELAPWAALEARHSGRCDGGWGVVGGILGAGSSS